MKFKANNQKTQNTYLQISKSTLICTAIAEVWLSGWKHRSWKPARGDPPRVRISALPPFIFMAKSTKILVVMRLSGFFYLNFFINLILIQSNSFQSTLRACTKTPTEKILELSCIFLLNSVISLCIIQRIKKMLGNYSWQGLLKNGQLYLWKK